jgi:hypothetical protein
MDLNATIPPIVDDYSDDFLKNMSDDDYVEFVAQVIVC